jgi:glutaredoxin
MNSIVLYSTPDCPRCKRLAVWLAEQGLEFAIMDLTIPAVLADLRINGCFDREAPVLQIGDKYHSTRWLYEGDVLQTGKLMEVLR